MPDASTTSGSRCRRSTEIEAIVAKAKAWQEKDDRVQIIDVKARESEGPRGRYVLTSAYIGYLLPMMVELQHLARHVVTVHRRGRSRAPSPTSSRPVVADDPGREALVTRSGRWSYAELDRARGPRRARAAPRSACAPATGSPARSRTTST